MAKHSGNASLASTKNVNTRWLQNAMKSIGVSSNEVLKQMAPNLYSVMDSGRKTSQNILSNLHRNSASSNQISRQLMNNKYVKFAQTAYKNALYDIKSGNLNNKERAMNYMIGDDNSFDSLFDDTEESGGFTFGDDGADVNINMIGSSTSENDAMFAMSTQIQKQTEATLKTSQANMNAMIAMNSVAMSQIGQLGNQLITGLESINQNLSALIEYNNSSMTKFIESSMAFYERMGVRFDSDNASYGSQYTRASDVLAGSSGGINMSTYKNYVKEQFKRGGAGTAGLLNSMLGNDELQMLAQNPLGFATEGIIKYMIPKMMVSTIQGAEEAFSAFMPSFLHDISKWADDQSRGALGMAKRFIGKNFGLREDRTDNINKANAIKTGPIPFDGQTKHAITEIITKELREQTAYLKAIAEKKGIDTNAARANADVFNFQTGKYMKASDTTGNILDEIKNATLSGMYDGAFGKEMKRLIDATEESNREAMSRMMDEFLIRLEKNGQTRPDMSTEAFNDSNSQINQILNQTSGSNTLRKSLKQHLQRMQKENVIASMDMSRSIYSGSRKRSDLIKNIEENPTLYNLFAATDLDLNDLDTLLLERMAATKSDAKIGSNKINYSGTYEKSDGQKFVERLRSSFKGGMKGTASAIISGDSKAAFNSVVSMVGEQTSILFDKINEKFFSPLKVMLLGSKNRDGYSENGILSGVQNSFKDMFNSIRFQVTGKEYTDSDGVRHKNVEGENSVIDDLKSIGSSVKSSIMKTLFGDENANISSFVKNSFKSGIDGWMESLFGSAEMTDEDKEKMKKKISENVKESLPNGVKGGTAGAAIGLLAGGSPIGALVCGPLGAAAIGSAIGFASRSEDFQDYVFGEKDENGKRMGGLISSKTQDFFKENKSILGAGAVLGAGIGTFTGAGVLGSIVGGPVAGALFGLAGATVLKSKMFSEFLFGDPETGQIGVLSKTKQAITDLFGDGFGADGVLKDKKKLLGMSAIGAGAGGLLGMLAGGPIVGSLLGLGVSIKAQSSGFHDWLFGTKDENGERLEEGVVGQFRNLLITEVINPFARGVQNLIDDAAYTLKNDILDNIRFAIEPITSLIGGAAKSVLGSVSNMFTKLGENLMQSPLITGLDKFVIAPIRGVVSGVTKMVWGAAKSAVTLPFKILGGFTKLITSPLVRLMKTATKGIGSGIKLFTGAASKFGGWVSEMTKPARDKVKQGLDFFVRRPLGTIGGVASYFANSVLNPNRVGKDALEYGELTGDEKKDRKAQRLIDLRNKNQAKAERKARTKNERAIRRATGGQVWKDTEENRDLAEQNGAKLDRRIKAIDSKKSTLNKNEAQIIHARFAGLSEEGKQTNVLLRILKLLQKNLDPEELKKDEERIKKQEEEDEAKLNGGKPKKKHWTEKYFEKLLKKEEEGKLKENYAKTVENRIMESGGFINWISNGFKNLWSKFKGKGFAEGTENAPTDEAVMVGENGPELMLTKGGEKIFANSKPLAVYIVGANEDSVNFGSVSDSDATVDSGDVVSNTVRAAAISGNNSVAMDMLAAAHQNRGGGEDNQEQFEDDQRSALTQIEANSRLEDARDKAYTAEELQAKAKEEEESARIDRIEENTEDQVKEQKGFGKLWSSIFSKKGLITGGLILALPWIIKGVKWLVNTFPGLIGGIGNGITFTLGLLGTKLGEMVDDIKDILDTVIDSVGKTAEADEQTEAELDKNGGLGDSKSSEEKKADLMTRAKHLLSWIPGFDDVPREEGDDGNGFLNEDGQYDHLTGSLTKGIVNNVFRRVTNSNFVNKAVSKVTGATVDKISSMSSKNLGKYIISSITSKAKDKLKTGTKAVLNTAVDAGKNTISEFLEKRGLKYVPQVIELVTKFFKGVASKLGIKTFADTTIGKLLNGVKRVIRRGIDLILGKVLKVLGINSGVALATAGVGYLIKEGACMTVSAIDQSSTSGVANLFRVRQEDVDGLMTTIAAAIGAFRGTTVGDMCDVVNEIYVYFNNKDMYTTLASFAYYLVSDDEDDKALTEARMALVSDYTDIYQEETLRPQYETMVKLGKINPLEVSFNDYLAEVRNVNGTTYKGSYKSFADYNDTVNKTVGSAMIEGTTNAIVGGAKGFSSVGSWLTSGISTTVKYDKDDKTVYYTNNHDGTWAAIKNGINVGNISEDQLKLVNTETVTNKSRSALSYFGIGGNGTTVNKNGNGGGTGRSFDTTDVRKFGFDALQINKKSTPASGTKTSFVYYTPELNYYKSDGNGFFDYYNILGDKIEGQRIDEIELGRLSASNKIKAGYIDEKSQKIYDIDKSEIISDVARSLAETMQASANTVIEDNTKAIEAIETASNAFSKINDGITKYVKSKSGTDAWYDSTMGFYTANGNTFDYHNAFGDVVKQNISADDVAKMIASNKLKKGAPYKDGKISNLIRTTQNTLTRAWNNAIAKYSSYGSNLYSTAYLSGLTVGVGTTGSLASRGYPSSTSGYTTTSGSGGYGVGGFGRLAKLLRGGRGNGVRRSNKPMRGGGAADELNGFPFYLQWDSRWGNIPYNVDGSGDTIGGTGCGPTAMAMVLRSFGANVTPKETAEWSVKNGHRTVGNGTYWSFFPAIGSKYGLTTTTLGVNSTNISNALSNKYPVIGSMTPGTFTTGGHFIVLVGQDSNGKILVNDPNSKTLSEKRYPMSTFTSEGAQYWSFNKNGKGSINNLFQVDGSSDSSTQSNETTNAVEGETTTTRVPYSTPSILEQIGAYFGEFANRALDGAITGNYNGDFNTWWQNYLSGSQVPGTTTTQTSSTTTNASIKTNNSTTTKSSSTDKVIMIGDSRTHGIALTIKAMNQGNHVFMKNNKKEYLIGKDGAGYGWINDAIASAKKLATSSSTVVFWLGINDCGYSGQASKYADVVNKFAKNIGCKVYYMTPGPCDLGRYVTLNNSCKSFNKELKNSLSSNVTYLDAYSYIEDGLKSGKFGTTDGIHYNSSTYKDIYQWMKTKVGFSGGSGSRIDTQANLKNSILSNGHIRFKPSEHISGLVSNVRDKIKNIPAYYRQNETIETRVEPPTGSSKDGTSVPSISGGSGKLPYYSQNDPMWSKSSYGNDGATMGDTGCGPTAMAMVASGLTGQSISPSEMANYAVSTGMRDDTGTNASFIRSAARDYGISGAESYYPSASDLYRAASSGPLVLLGQNGGGVSNPYTNKGHYVVADGVDGNGMINIKDPRGSGYNRKYKASDLANTTGTMWNFSGGFGDGRKRNRSILSFKPQKLRGGRGTVKTVGTREGWLNAVRNWIHTMETDGDWIYSNSQNYTDPRKARNAKSRRTNCALMVVHCLHMHNVFSGSMKFWSSKNGTIVYRGTGTRERLKEVATIYNYYGRNLTTNKISLKPGDIVLFASGGSGHTNIYMGKNKNGIGTWYDAGTGTTINHCVNSKWKSFARAGNNIGMYVAHVIRLNFSDPDSNPVSPITGHSYRTPAVTVAVNVDMSKNGQTTTTSNSDSSTSTDSTTNNSSTTGTTELVQSGMQSGSAFEKISSFMGEFANRALKGALTGEYDTDWDKFWNGVEVTTTTAADTSSSDSSDTSTSSNVDISGNSDAEKIWNYLKAKGIPDNGIAGMMGNIQAESGCIFNNVENWVASKYGSNYSDSTFTRKVDNGTMTKNQYMYTPGGGNFGYGICQWTWPTRKEKLYNMAKSRGTSIADPKTQLDHLWNELSDSYPSVLNVMKNKNSSLRTVSDKVLYDFENPAAASSKSGTRYSYSKSFLSKYGGKGGFGSGPRGGRGSIPYYSQTDPSWSGNAYGNDGATMGDTGCGPTVMAMVASGLTGQNVTPTEMASFASATGMRDDTGTNSNFINQSAAAYGIGAGNESYYPDASSIYRAASSGPLVLLGQNNGGTNPYTNSGHYVVADGVDGNGMINIKDPRGAGYNRKYSAYDLANSTGTMWDFGGYGNRETINPRSILTFKRGVEGGYGTVDRTQWINIIRAVKKAIANKKPGYSQSKKIQIKVGGKTKTLRTDCSGFVGVCMDYYGRWSGGGTACWTGVMGRNSSSMKNSGFKAKSWPGWDGLKEGDILVNTATHTEIFAYNKNGKHYVYNCGSTSSVNNPNPTTSSGKYELVWEPGTPGKNAVNVGTTTTTTTTTTTSSGKIVVGTRENWLNAIRYFVHMMETDGDWHWEYQVAILDPWKSGKASGKEHHASNCSTFASQCLYVFGAFAKENMRMWGSLKQRGRCLTKNKETKDLMNKIGKIYRSDTERSPKNVSLLPGDICCYKGHVNIYMGKNKKGVSTWYDAGRWTTNTGARGGKWKSLAASGNDLGFKVRDFYRLNFSDPSSNPVSPITGRGYKTPKTSFNKINVNSLQTTSNATTSSTISFGDNGMFDQMTAYLSEVATRAMEGFVTGDYNSDWSTFTGTSTPSTSGSGGSGGYGSGGYGLGISNRRDGSGPTFANTNNENRYSIGFMGGSGYNNPSIRKLSVLSGVKREIISGGRGDTSVVGGSMYTSQNNSSKRDYIRVSSAKRYIDNVNDSSMTNAVNMIITLLEAVAGNTADTSSKLNLLKNINGGTNANLVTGGNTTNIITPNGVATKTTDPVVSGNGNTKSRNYVLAERIASGR